MRSLSGPRLLLLLLGTFSITEANLVITPSGQDHSVFQGSNFFVSCSSDAANVQRVMWTGPEDQQITNYKGSVANNEIPRIYVEDGRSGHKGVDLVFENITRKDRGLYTCSAYVDGNEESRSFELFVHKRINFMDTPTVQYLEEGQDSELSCNVDGDPIPTVTWRMEGKRVTFGDKYDPSVEWPNNLIIRNVTLEDAGEYRCVASQLSSQISEFQDLPITVKVHHKPQWLDDHMDQAYSYVTGEVNLTCEAVAEPHANFTWMKENEVIVPSDTVQIFNDDHKSVLKLTVTEPDMFGDYLCKAENRLGTLARVIILERGAKPAVPVAKVTHADVDALHLNLTAKNHPEMPIVAYHVQYKMPGDDWKFAPAIEFKEGDRYIINSLAYDTLYVLRASARNVAGYSDYSSEVMERTKKVQAQNIQSTSSTVLVSYAFNLFTLVLSAFFL